ncbi:hypothetical protein [Marinisporobacter balticus]|uniref:Uncharacterized protein n=1 Tax=Marinisporobacter balticus TaxID=2018667 RepID=A0A4R2KNF9_9FIRM|nr:hypothetical protein [Marinisporobacter balticus]TCO75243.1 hypothetical protein EV214_10980 [Marinisporobacter balticus]
MNEFINRIFRNLTRKESKKRESNVGLISKMPENVLYGEDPGIVPSDDLKNQLDNDIK